MVFCGWTVSGFYLVSLLEMGFVSLLCFIGLVNGFDILFFLRYWRYTLSEYTTWENKVPHGNLQIMKCQEHEAIQGSMPPPPTIELLKKKKKKSHKLVILLPNSIVTMYAKYHACICYMCILSRGIYFYYSLLTLKIWSRPQL